MATTNFYLVKALDEKIIPFVKPRTYGPLDNLIVSRDDLASLRNAGWTIINVRPLPETAKIKYDRRTTYFKVKDESDKFINIPFYINPIDTREVVGLLKFELINITDKEVVDTFNPKDYGSDILNIPTSSLEIGKEYKVRLLFNEDAPEEYTIANLEGYRNFFEKVYDEVFIKVKEYGRFTGRLVQLEQNISVSTESVLPLDKILGYKDFDTKKINAVTEDKLINLLHVNVSNENFARYEADKNRLVFLSTEGKFNLRVFENGIGNNIVNFNIEVLKPETFEARKNRGYSFNHFDSKANSFEKVEGENKIKTPKVTEGDVAEPTSPKDDENATVTTGGSGVEVNSDTGETTSTETE